MKKKTEVKWKIFGSEKPSKMHAILESVENYRPDLIVTYRHLHCDSVDWSYGLGIHIDVLTQATTTPVLILPNPDRNNLANSSFKRTKKVMAVTDHLAGDHSLVSYAALFTQTDGTLFLAHVEDKSVFDRYIKAVSKIPDLDTETAIKQIKARLLTDPNDYVESCKKRLPEALPTINKPKATAGPIPKAKKNVPKPTVPPKYQPIETTEISRNALTTAIGRFVFFCKPTIKPSLGPAPKFATK